MAAGRSSTADASSAASASSGSITESTTRSAENRSAIAAAWRTALRESSEKSTGQRMVRREVMAGSPVTSDVGRGRTWQESRRYGQTELLDTIPDLIAVQPEQRSRPRLVPVAPLERLDHEAALELLEVESRRGQLDAVFR